MLTTGQAETSGFGLKLSVVQFPHLTSGNNNIYLLFNYRELNV